MQHLLILGALGRLSLVLIVHYTLNKMVIFIQHLLDGGGRDLPLAPLPRGCERHRHVATEPAIGESGTLRGPRSWGPDARLPGRSTSPRAAGEEAPGPRPPPTQSGCARSCRSGQGVWKAPRGRYGSSPAPRRRPPGCLSPHAAGPPPRVRAPMVAPRRPPPPGRSGNGPAAAGGSRPAALSQETRGPPAKLPPTAPATLWGRASVLGVPGRRVSGASAGSAPRTRIRWFKWLPALHVRTSESLARSPSLAEQLKGTRPAAYLGIVPSHTCGST